MEKEKTLDEICFDFQQKIVNVFNNDNYHLPFLLKYYLIKEIWEEIEQMKFKNDVSLRSKL